MQRPTSPLEKWERVGIQDAIYSESGLILLRTTEPMPQFYEIDFRIDPLRDVIVGINAGIAAIRKRVDNGGWFNGLHGLEYSEPLFGLSLVAEIGRAHV